MDRFPSHVYSSRQCPVAPFITLFSLWFTSSFTHSFILVFCHSYLYAFYFLDYWFSWLYFILYLPSPLSNPIPFCHVLYAMLNVSHRRHALRRRRSLVAKRAISLAGISCRPLGLDSAGRGVLCCGVCDVWCVIWWGVIWCGVIWNYETSRIYLILSSSSSSLLFYSHLFLSPCPSWSTSHKSIWTDYQSYLYLFTHLYSYSPLFITIFGPFLTPLFLFLTPLFIFIFPIRHPFNAFCRVLDISHQWRSVCEVNSNHTKILR